MSKKILVVDDEEDILNLVRLILEDAGYQVRLETDGRDALKKLETEKFDLILLDIMMPKMDGYQFLRQYRQERQTPIIIITAREEETDAVLGLDLGADDYVIKPFRMRELMARIRAVMRRIDGASEQAELLRAGDVVLDQATHMVTIRGQAVTLTPLEFDMLAVLMHSPGQVFTRGQLVEHLLNSGFTGLDRTLNVHVRNLRTKIEADPGNPQYIETVFGVGYRFHKSS
jgi:DNA-binding response OmpR family regulator